MNENELIKVNYEDNNRPTVMGRELQGTLEVKTDYPHWFSRMVEYGFNENVDYSTIVKNVRRQDGTLMPQTSTDHQLTLDMAKELCMLQRNEKGKMFRQYFIEVEKKWKCQMQTNTISTEDSLIIKTVKAGTLEERMLALNEYTKYIQQPLLNTISEQQPKVEYHDEVLNKDDLMNISIIAKDLGITARELNKTLHDNRAIFKQNNTWLIYANYSWLIDEHYADYKSYKNENYPPQLKWTEKGHKWIIKTFFNNTMSNTVFGKVNIY